MCPPRGLMAEGRAMQDAERERPIFYASYYEMNGVQRPIEGPSPEELADIFRPEDQLSADPEAMAMVFDTLSNHLFDSWTDRDLYRAIDAPEYPEGHPKHEAEVLEYVDELKKRKAAREALAARSSELREKYQI